MKSIIVLALVCVSTFASASPIATFAGSDTLAGAITSAIDKAGLTSQLQYTGGGSGLGEKGLLSGDQGIAPMSRPISQAAIDQLKTQNITVVEHVLGLDGISLFVNANNHVASLDLDTALKIYTCAITKWEQIPGSGQSGTIAVYRRNDHSGTTDAFKLFTGLKAFGPCVTVVAETADIADKTSKDVLAIGYAGLSGKVDGNRSAAVAKAAGQPAILPTTATIRNFSYPMARKLFVYEVTGARGASDIEQTYLSNITDRSFMDPIMQENEFITLD